MPGHARPLPDFLAAIGDRQGVRPCDAAAYGPSRQMKTHIGRFAIHAHSEWSYDGRFRLRTLARVLASIGYRGVLMSEHDRGFDNDRWAAYQEECARASSATFLVIPGIEYSSPDNLIHVPTWGDLPFLGEGLDTTTMLHHVHAAGGIAVLAHPSRQAAWNSYRPEWSPYLLGVEIWNVKHDGYAPSAEGSDLWREHPSLMPFAALDFHTGRQIFPLALEIRVNARSTRENVQTALREKECRSIAFRSPAETFTRGRRSQTVVELERWRTRAFRHGEKVVNVARIIR